MLVVMALVTTAMASPILQILMKSRDARVGREANAPLSS